MWNIYVNYPMNLSDVMRKYQLHMDSLINMQIGNDDQLYLLINTQIPKRINGMFVSSESNSAYFVLILTIDWSAGEVISDELISLGILQGNYHYIQPINEFLLLVGARSYYRIPVPEQNAAIISRQGEVQYELCLGDGINDCIVNAKNEIITSYFDEGVYGNNGWNNPIGRNGIVRWNQKGDILWEAKYYGISDCYAMNIDSRDNLWFYYYTSFNLVKTDYHRDVTYHPDIDGADAFLITATEQKLLFDGGYNMHSQFQSADIVGQELKNYQRVDIVYEEKPLILKRYSFRGSKAAMIDTENRLFVKEIIT